MIDWTRVEELRAEIGAEDFAEVVEIFLDETDAAMAEIGGEPAALAAQLHFLKGCALNLGFAAFCAQCAQGETRASNGTPDVDLAAITMSYTASRAAFLEGLRARFAA